PPWLVLLVAAAAWVFWCNAMGPLPASGRRPPADRRDFCLDDDLSPFCHFGLHVTRELGRTPPAWHNAKLQEPRLDLGRGHHRGDFLLKQVDDRLRRTRRHEYAGHGLGLLILNAEFVERRNLGGELDAFVGSNREHT